VTLDAGVSQGGFLVATEGEARLVHLVGAKNLNAQQKMKGPHGQSGNYL
jgi:hypothetical protein